MKHHSDEVRALVVEKWRVEKKSFSQIQAELCFTSKSTV